jgi:hypothetical protein
MANEWSRARPDLSTKLVHSVKGETMDDAFDSDVTLPVLPRRLIAASFLARWLIAGCLCYST